MGWFTNFGLRGPNFITSVGNAAPDPSNITFVGGSTGEISAGRPATTVSLPPGVQAGDFIIVLTAKDSAAGVSAPGTPGYTQRVQYSGSTPDAVMYYKVAEAGETLTVNNTSSTNSAVVVAVYRGVDQTTPFDVVDPPPVIDGGTAPDSPPITSITPNAWVLSVAAMDDDGVGSTPTLPSGFTDLVWRSTATGGTSNQATIAIASFELETPGIKNPGSWQFAASDTWVAGTHALRPA